MPMPLATRMIWPYEPAMANGLVYGPRTQQERVERFERKVRDSALVQSPIGLMRICVVVYRTPPARTAFARRSALSASST